MPVDGLVYWWDATAQTWNALWREPIVVTPDPDPGSGYGSDGYGDGPYGG